MCYTLFFYVLQKRGQIYSTVLHEFKFQLHIWIFDGPTSILLFSGPVHLDLRDAIPLVSCVPTVSSLLSIISDATKEYSTRTVRKRKYQRYLDTIILLLVYLLSVYLGHYTTVLLVYLLSVYLGHYTIVGLSFVHLLRALYYCWFVFCSFT